MAALEITITGCLATDLEANIILEIFTKSKHNYNYKLSMYILVS